MDPSTRSLLVSVSAFALALATADGAYGRYARKHFGPEVTLQQAEADGDGCVVTLGDSRMAAGIDKVALRDALHANGVDACVAPLGIGALPISGQAMALRRYVRGNHKPVVVVLGVSVGTLLSQDPPDPSTFFGNRAAELAWSVASDADLYYPAFPFAHLDRGLRFSFARLDALSIYASLLWIKTQAVQECLAGNAVEQPHSRFGSLADMHSLLDSFRDEATRDLARWDGHFRLTPWFEMVRQLTQQSGARLIVVEVPMPSRYRAEVLASPPGRRYSAWLKGEIDNGGDQYLDLSAPPSVSDTDFGDGIHLDASGAQAFSRDLGVVVAKGTR